MKKVLIIIAILLNVQYLWSANKAYVLVNFSNCSFCNNSLRVIKDPDNFIASSILLGRADDATVNQLKSLAEDNFRINFRKYIINTQLFDKISNGNLSKIPDYAIVNSSGKVIFRTTVDSLNCYRSLIESYLSPKLRIKKIKEIRNSRISNIGGYSSIEVYGNTVAISMFTKSDRIYFLNTENETLDSLYFSRDWMLLGKLFKMSKESSCNPKDVVESMQNNSLPFDLHRFGNLSTHGDVITTTDHLLFLNPNDSSEILTANWKQFLVSISLKKKAVSFYYIDQWHDSVTKPDLFRPYEFNDFYYNKETDSTWIISAKRVDEKDPLALNLYMVRFKLNSGNLLKPLNVDSFTRIAFVDFLGNTLNKPGFIIPFDYKEGVLFFNESPNILVGNEWLNLKKILPGITWIYDIEMQPDGKVLSMLIRENVKSRYFVRYDLVSHSFLSKVALPKFESKSNVKLAKDRILFINPEGLLCQFRIE